MFYDLRTLCCVHYTNTIVFVFIVITIYRNRVYAYNRRKKESIYYEKDSNNEETLHFNLKSNIKGNDLLTIFCEDYDPVLVDFPFPINVTAKGVINYTNQKKTTIQSNVQNGSCTFAGAKLVNIDAVLYMKNEEISFKNAEMNFCKGVCKADFNYNFETFAENIRVKV